jgi:AraC family L-rhamnose operon transcriptional activator RhaR
MPVRRAVTLLTGEAFFDSRLPIYVNRVAESFELTEHFHDFLEISYVGEGTGTHHAGDSVMTVARGDIFLIPVGISHVFRPASTSKDRPLIVYNCIVTIDAITRLLQTIPGGGELEMLVRFDRLRHYRDRHGEFERLFQQLHYEYAMDRPGRETVLYTGVANLLIYLLRAESESETAAAAVSPGVEEVLVNLHNGFREPVKAKDMAALIGVSERQFHRIFTKQTGMTFTDYLQNVRINEACRLLRTTGRKVSDIASSVGYQDITFFNGLFKKKTGVSPRQFRRRYLSSADAE